jgi:hypothetical protein
MLAWAERFNTLLNPAIHFYAEAMPVDDPIDDYRSALERLTSLTTAVAAQREQADVLKAITALRLAVVRAYGGRRPRNPTGRGAQTLIIEYLQEHINEWVYGDELAAVSGIGEWARRVRELRVERGYEIDEDGGRYRLRGADPDRLRADRWRMVGEIQEMSGSPESRVAELLQRTAGSVVDVDELDRVSGSPVGARIARMLRAEDGLPIETDADAPDLLAGQYRLASRRESSRLEPSQRLFGEDLRRDLHRRDHYRCWSCRNARGDVRLSEADPFFLLVRHLDASGDVLFGLSAERLNELSRLATLCNRCAASNRSRE